MMLNGLTSSLDNIIEGDTLDTPAHYKIPHEPSSGVKQFDFITSNPPFRMDFSSTRDSIENKWAESEERDGIRRFFAGVPKIPNAKKDSMAIYLCFIQHILWSLKDDGKAAIVVPAGFLTAQSGIEKTIRQTIVENKWLKGVISMPPNIFANTGTSVSVLFIDKSNVDGEIMLVDASKLGKKIKEGKNQRTVLDEKEVSLIEDTFINCEEVDDFSVKVAYEQMVEKNYSFSAGRYFEVKIKYIDISKEEFDAKLNYHMDRIETLFTENKVLETSIKDSLGRLYYE